MLTGNGYGIIELEPLCSVQKGGAGLVELAKVPMP